MGLACSQIRLLTLTARKADCEHGISIDSMRKMALTREQSQLSKEYQSKLQGKHISYINNGQYNKMTYSYLMGNGAQYTAITKGSLPLKGNNKMILADYKGQTVLSDDYAKAITSVLGSDAMDKYGRGGTFDVDKIPEILSHLFLGNYGSWFTADNIRSVRNGGQVDSEYAASVIKTLSGENTGDKTTVENTAKATELVNSVLDFYYPIFQSAAANGWTKEYNKDMATNEDYVSDALVTGSFQLETVDDTGEYDEGTSLTYFITSGAIQSRATTEDRENVTAWYEAEKARIAEKENYLDIHMDDLSTELEAINTEIQSIQSLIDDAISSVFDWGSS